MMATVIYPPNEYELDGKSSVFLAGSIDMGKEKTHWQDDVIKSLKDTSCVILNPRRKDWDSSWKQDISNDKFREQVEWELKGLEQCSLIALCLSKDSKAPISLLELGLHISDGRMIVCCPEGYWRKGNVDIVCKKYGVPVFEDFDEFKKEAKKRLENPEIAKTKTASDRMAWRVVAREFIVGMKTADITIDDQLSALTEMGVVGLSKVAGPNDIRWQAVFMMGMSGAGKTWYRTKTYMKYMRFKLIDPDEVKERHPEYDPERPYIVHEWSKNISDSEYNTVISDGQGDPVIVDGTGRNPEGIQRKMEMARANGYRIFLVYVRVPLEVSLWRNRNRERFIPEDKMINVYKGYDVSFSQLKGLADSYKVIPNFTSEDLRNAEKDLKVYPAPQSERPPRPGDANYGKEPMEMAAKGRTGMIDSRMNEILKKTYCPKAGMGDTHPFGSPLRNRRDYGSDGESEGRKLPSEDIMTSSDTMRVKVVADRIVASAKEFLGEEERC